MSFQKYDKKLFVFLGFFFVVVFLSFAQTSFAKRKPKYDKLFQVTNHDLAAYMIYFGCPGLNAIKQEVGPGETIELGGNDKTCHIMVRPSAAIHTKIFQKSCDKAATLTILNGRVEIEGCQAD